MRAISFALLLGAMPLLAQQPMPLTEKIDVSAVNVDVTVLDRQRNPVRGLTAADFEVFEDGVAQRITNFYAVENGGIARTTAVEPDAERFRRKVLVIVDNTALCAKPRRNLLLNKLESFIDQHFSGDYEWAIVPLGGPQSPGALPFTQDKETIHNAIEALRRDEALPRDMDFGEISRTTQSACRILQEQSFLSQLLNKQVRMKGAAISAAVEEMCDGLAAAPGKKVILLVTDAIPSGSFRADLPDDAILIQKMHEAVVRSANAANVNVFVMNTEGLTDGGTPGRPFTLAADESGGFWLATETGGRYLHSSSFSESLQTFENATANFYSLGYIMRHAEDAKYHRISVRLKGPGSYALSYRLGFSSRSTEQQLERALRTPLGIATQRSTLPLTMEVGAPSQVGAKVVVALTAMLPAERVQAGRLDLYVTVFDQTGRKLGFHHFRRDIETIETPQLVLTTRLTFPHGSYRLVMTLRDEETNEIGIASSDATF
ncbi:MAG TPA: VWA domain-containing protein [Thermoanaerobaculia bacterium]|nr:VWA domain-containing protein [Thermoanaerobaculia bacterium]